MKNLKKPHKKLGKTIDYDHSQNNIDKVKPYKSIRMKIFGAFLISVFLIVILGTVSYNKFSSSIIKSSETSTMNSLDFMGEYLSIVFETQKSSARDFVLNRSLIDYYAGKYNDSVSDRIAAERTIVDSIVQIQLTSKYIVEAYITGDKGTWISTMGKVSSTYNDIAEVNSIKSFIDSGLDEGWIGRHDDLYEVVDTNVFKIPRDLGLAYIRYFYNTNGEKLGLVMIDISKSFIEETIEKNELPDGSIVGFVALDGNEIIIGSENDEFKFSDLGIQFSERDEDGHIKGLEYIDYSGQEYLFVYSGIDESGSTVFAMIPKSEIISTANVVKQTTGTLATIAAIISIACAMFISKGISGSIFKVNGILQNVAGGDLTGRIEFKSEDEFKYLGRAINMMLDSMSALIRKAGTVSGGVAESAGEFNSKSENIVESAHGINEVVKDIEEGINDQAEQASNCTIQMSELGEQISQTYMNTEMIETLVKNTQDMANYSMDIIKTLSETSEITNTMTQTVVSDIQNLDKDLKSIAEIVNTINNIAEQTKLLSLNASIEAARAGHAGRGFEVVAQEIRKLANSSSVSANEINTIASEIQKQTSITVNNAVTAETSIYKQRDALGESVKAYQSINSNVDELADKFTQILSSVRIMENKKNITLDSMSNITATLEETASASTEMKRTVERQLELAHMLKESAEELGMNAEGLSDNIKIFTVS
ncbi:MAG: methyl-accepting chemotaxis protein [Anaerolineaceae bacterium]|nr:MAG: methyl-accepting chemotaxis protein [Anaerolineaceae bacterium]